MKYTCRSKIATCEICRHHSFPSSLAVNGGFAIESNGRAPSASSAVRNWSTFERYCPFVVDQGVGVCAPKSSFSAIIGVWQPVTETA